MPRTALTISLLLLYFFFPACGSIGNRPLPFPPGASSNIANSPIWTFRTKNEPWQAFIMKGTLFAENCEYVYGIDPSSGSEKWRRENNCDSIQDAIFEEAFYLYDSHLNNRSWCAISPETGQELWRFKDKPTDDVYLSDIVATSDEILVFSSESGVLHGVDSRTGEIKWNHNFKNAPNQIKIFNGVVYISRYDGFTRAIDQQSGKLLWRTRNERKHVMTVDETTVYCRSSIDDDDSILGIDRLTGKRRWRFTPDGSSWQIIPFAGKAFTVIDKKGVLCLDPRTGRPQWQYQSSVEPTGMVPTEKVVYVSGKDGKVYGIDTQTGAPVRLPDYALPVKTVQAAHGGLLFVIGLDGRLHALEALPK